MIAFHLSETFLKPFLEQCKAETGTAALDLFY